MVVRAGFVQFAPIFGEVKTNLAKAQALLEDFNGDIAVLPEFFNTGYLFTDREELTALAEEIPDGATTKMLVSVARQKSIHIVAGLPERAAGGKNFFNSALIASPQGVIGRYRKVHLFSDEKLFFTPGDTGLNVFDIGSCKIGIMICFDWFFPEAMRALSLKGADVICHCANLVLPFCQNSMPTRCLENGVFAITANRTGSDIRGDKRLDFTGASQITGVRGEIIHRAAADRDEMVSVELDIAAARNKRLNPYNDLFADRRASFYSSLLDE